jgi:hypothetical protein
MSGSLFRGLWRIFSGVKEFVALRGPGMTILATGRRAVLLVTFQATLMKGPLQPGLFNVKQVDVLFEQGEI